MRLKTHLILASASLLSAGAWAAEKVSTTQRSIPMQIMDSGLCMVTECGLYSLIFIILPAFAVYFYRTYIRIGI